MNIKNYLNEEGQIKIWPSKQMKKLEVLKYLVQFFQFNYNYSEKEVNEIINKHHTFNDYFLLRRELINNHLLSRTTNGAKYWRNVIEIK